MHKNLVLADFQRYCTWAGSHLFDPMCGVQALFEFPNGFGASVAFVPGLYGTQGVELQVFMYRGAWWRLIGMPFTHVDEEQVRELLTNIIGFDDRRLS